MSSDTEIIFSQYAQDPYDFTGLQCSEPEHSKPTKQSKKLKLNRREKKKQKQKTTQSFIMSRLQRRGIKLIKISVIDLCNNNPQTEDSDSDSENLIINAQYIVKDALDSVMDDTVALVKKISKSLLDDDF